MSKDFKFLGSERGDFYATFNDIVIYDNDIALVDGHQKIQQDVVKFLYVLVGTLPLFPKYGTNLPNLLNRRNRELLIQDLQKQIRRGLAYVKEKNKNDNVNIDKLMTLRINELTRTIDIDIVILLTDKQVLTIQFKRGEQ